METVCDPFSKLKNNSKNAGLGILRLKVFSGTAATASSYSDMREAQAYMGASLIRKNLPPRTTVRP